MKWTSDQKNAILSDKREILLAAAAGSGKTAVLIERIAFLITEKKIDISKFLVVTFTNAAAGEMRGRLIKRLKEIAKDTEQVDKRKFIEMQIINIHMASIQTFHSFCMDVVRKYFYIVEIDPLFSIIDSSERDKLLDDSITSVMDEIMYSSFDFADNLYYLFNEKFKDDQIKIFIKNIYGYLMSQPKGIEWFGDKINLEADDYKLFLIKNTRKILKIELESIQNQIESANREVLEHDIKEYKDCIGNELNTINEILKLLIDNNDFDRLIEMMTFDRLKSVKNKELKDIANVIKEKRNSYKKSYKKILDDIDIFNIESQISMYLEMKPTLEYINKIIIKLHQKFTEEKQKLKKIDFNDLEHLALKILEYDESVKYYNNYYKYIFIDEYQDTSELQEIMIGKISANKNIFQVGDYKQSIYGFRHAEPKIFKDKMEKYKLYKDMECLYLNHNFRSYKNILQDINGLFSFLMNGNQSEIIYNNNEKLNEGLIYNKEYNPNTICLFTEDEDNQSKIERETENIAKYIKETVGTKMYDAKKNCFRNIMYKDIVILLRGVKGKGSKISTILQNNNIPCYLDIQEGYFDSIEIQTLINLFSLIDNMNNDYALAAILRSPIVEISENELAQIRLIKTDGFFFEAVKEYSLYGENDKLKSKLVNFYNRIKLYKEQKLYYSLSQWVWMILNDTEYYQIVSILPNGVQRIANIDLFLERIEYYEKNISGDLKGFLLYIEHLENTDNQYGSATVLSESSNVVRIMTIHKSKGLEFPIVICMNLDKKINFIDLYKKILLDVELGIGIPYINKKEHFFSKSLNKYLIKRELKLKTLNEEMRILYVALTRATNQIVLSGYVKDISKKLSKYNAYCNPFNATSYLDWLLMYISKYIIIGEDIEITGEYNIGGNKWLINTIDEIEKVEAVIVDKNEKLLDFSVDSSFKEWIYPNKADENLPLKINATQLQTFNKPVVINKKHDVNANESKLDSTLVGLNYHKILELIPINMDLNFDNISNFIDELILNKKLFEEAIPKNINRDIFTFFNSDLGSRMIKSKKIYRELPFVYKKKLTQDASESSLVQGVIDCCFKENSYILVDYKTGYVGRDEQNIIKKNLTQLKMYKEAFEAITMNKISETYIYSFSINKAIKVDF